MGENDVVHLGRVGLPNDCPRVFARLDRDIGGLALNRRLIAAGVRLHDGQARFVGLIGLATDVDHAVVQERDIANSVGIQRPYGLGNGKGAFVRVGVSQLCDVPGGAQRGESIPMTIPASRPRSSAAAVTIATHRLLGPRPVAALVGPSAGSGSCSRSAGACARSAVRARFELMQPLDVLVGKRPLRARTPAVGTRSQQRQFLMFGGSNHAFTLPRRLALQSEGRPARNVAPAARDSAATGPPSPRDASARRHRR